MAEERETEAVELKPQGQTDAMEQRSKVAAAPTISQTELLMDERYESRTCGQAPELVARLRSAQVLHDGGDSDALRSLCDELLGALRCSGSAARVALSTCKLLCLHLLVSNFLDTLSLWSSSHSLCALFLAHLHCPHSFL